MALGLLLEVPRGVSRGKTGQSRGAEGLFPVEVYKRHVCIFKHMGPADCIYMYVLSMARTLAELINHAPALAAGHQPQTVHCTGIMKTTSGKESFKNLGLRSQA